MVGGIDEVTQYIDSIMSSGNSSISWQLQANSNSNRFTGKFNQTGMNFHNKDGDRVLKEGPHNGPALYEISFDKPGGEIVVGVNGHPDIHEKITYQTRSNSKTLQFMTSKDGSACVHGWIGEILVVRGALDQSTREKIQGYLCYKWDLRDHMDNDHVHKTYAPVVTHDPNYLVVAASTEGTLAWEDQLGDPWGSGVVETRGIFTYALQKWTHAGIPALSSWQDTLPVIQDEIDELRGEQTAQTIVYYGSSGQLTKPVLGGMR